MAVKTVPLAQPELDTGYELPGMRPTLTYGVRCQACQRDYWLSWEPDYSAQNIEKRVRMGQRISRGLVILFALSAGLFFVGAVLFTFGGRL